MPVLEAVQTFAGITNETEIDNLVAYLKQFDKDGKKK